jgi:hypothetical protein
MSIKNYIVRSFLSVGILILLVLAVNTLGAAPLTKGPYLLQPRGQSITVRWELAQAAETLLEYGMPGKAMAAQKASLRGIKDGACLYEAILPSLLPGRTYLYRVLIDGAPGVTFSFKVPSPQSTRCDFVAMGDSRSNPQVFRQALALTKKYAPEFIISMGDLVANGGDAGEWPRFYFQPAESLIARIPHISTLGDHEGSGDAGELFRHFFLEAQSVEEQWFSFDWGPAHFVSLDYRCPDNMKMIEWFKQDMAASRAKWKFVYMHRPCYNFGGHRSYWGGPLWQQLFRAFQVDIVFAGHSHQYERFYPTRPASQPQSWPVTYITTGGAGASLYEVMQHPFLAVAASEYHIVTVHISRDTLKLAALRPDGSTLDSMEIIKRKGVQQPAYLAQVVPQEQLNILNTFAQALTFSMDDLPLSDRPHRQTLQIGPMDDLASAVHFEVRLTPESAAHYRMDPAADSLAAHKGVERRLEIFSEGDVTVSMWGDIKPALQLEAIVRSQYGSDRMVGGPIEYWPGDE